MTPADRRAAIIADIVARTGIDDAMIGAAEHFIERAHRVAESLELGIAGQHRVLLMKGERLERPDADVFLPASRLEQTP
jgi:hemoglobin